MRIAQVAPLFESVPPHLYGGTERVVSYLTEELVRLGHQVTLFASGDSVTRARLIAGRDRALRLDPRGGDPVAPHVLMLERVCGRRHEFDLIHCHVDYLAYPFARRHRVPTVTTLHGRLDLPHLVDVYEEFRDIPVVSISRAQRAPVPHANWVGTVHHGLPEHLLAFHAPPGRYLAFLGRASPEKRIDRAFVEWLGEIDEAEKGDFLGGATALLFPIDWPEPFGLAMIEALACGTPVVAFHAGSTPEIIEPGVTGFVVRSIAEAVEAVREAARLDRAACRAAFEARFSVTRMARDYLAIYERLTAGGVQHAAR